MELANPAAALATDAGTAAGQKRRPEFRNTAEYLRARLGITEATECALTRQARESDTDILAAVTRRWEAAVDPDGTEPTEELLRTRQGVFDRGLRRGLHRLEIAATDAQYEALITVMNKSIFWKRAEWAVTVASDA